MEEPAPPAPPGPFASRAIDLVGVLRFYTRLPVPDLRFDPSPHAAPDFRRAVWAVPIAGAIIGAIGAATGFLAAALHLAPAIATLLALAAMVVATGAFHEDGLADCADGFWGGMTPERRLEILKDSRIGTYGGAALVLSIGLRAAGIAELLRLLGPAALCWLPAIGAASRVFGLLPARLLPPARPDGLAATVPLPGTTGLALAGAIALTFALPLPFAFDWPPEFLLAFLAPVPLVALAIRLARTKIEGVTGDVLGATQQLAEIALLLALAALANAQGPI